MLSADVFKYYIYPRLELHDFLSFRATGKYQKQLCDGIELFKQILNVNKHSIIIAIKRCGYTIMHNNVLWFNYYSLTSTTKKYIYMADELRMAMKNKNIEMFKFCMKVTSTRICDRILEYIDNTPIFNDFIIQLIDIVENIDYHFVETLGAKNCDYKFILFDHIYAKSDIKGVQYQACFNEGICKLGKLDEYIQSCKNSINPFPTNEEFNILFKNDSYDILDYVFRDYSPDDIRAYLLHLIEKELIEFRSMIYFTNKIILAGVKPDWQTYYDQIQLLSDCDQLELLCLEAINSDALWREYAIRNNVLAIVMRIREDNAGLLDGLQYAVKLERLDMVKYYVNLLIQRDITIPPEICNTENVKITKYLRSVNYELTSKFRKL